MAGCRRHIFYPDVVFVDVRVSLCDVLGFGGMDKMAATSAAQTFIEISTEEIGDSYANLRMVNADAYTAMERSIAQYGQITPVVVGQPAGSKYELVDGFKRYRACKKLGHKSLSCQVLKGKERVLKSAMLCLNMQVSTIGDLEQGMIIQSFYKDDGLSQVEIAKLLSRHKSWVSRRLSLVERLSDEVIDQMRLGLIGTSIGRELARLPRGNQKEALETLQKYRFTARETARLVSFLMEKPAWNHKTILNFPEEILSQRQPKSSKKSGEDTLLRFYGDLSTIERLCSRCAATCAHLSNVDRHKVLSGIERITELLTEIGSRFSLE
jgi:ParB/RepB/Spo0J family partition protein